MNKTAAALLATGLACLAVGAYQLHPAAAWLVTGVALLVAGVLWIDTDRPTDDERTSQ